MHENGDKKEQVLIKLGYNSIQFVLVAVGKTNKHRK